MRILSVLLLMCMSLFASPPGVTDPFIPGAPPVTTRAFSSQPLPQINTPVTAPAQRFALMAAATSPTLVMKLLVVTDTSSEISYEAITTFLGQIGVPYDSVILGNITPDGNGNRLSTLALSDPATGHGNYQGIILANNVLGGLLSTTDWSTLDTYATQFNVRLVSYYTSPQARWGLLPADNGNSYTAGNALQAQLTTAGATVFPYINSANAVPVGGNSTSGIWAYMATTTAATGETTTPLLTVGSYTIAATHTTAAGEQSLALTFDNYPTLLHSLAFNYGVINWVTNGVFLGSRQIYLSIQIDDYFIGDRLYAPTLPQCPNDSSCPTMFVESTDMNALLNWEDGVRENVQFNNFHNAFAYVGIGTTWYPANDPLFTTISQVKSQFGWISHTYTHSNLDCYTQTAGGACVPATVAESLYEIQQNLAVATNLGLAIDPTGIVTPFNSGLANANFLAAAVQSGISGVIYPGAGPSPNVGYVDAVNPAIYEVPRLYTNLFDDVESPDTGVYGSWPDEYNAMYGPGGTNPAFTTNQTYAQILDNESQNVLLLDMLDDQNDMLGFHICDMWAYDGVHSLFTDLMDATMTKYKAVFNLPITSLSMSAMTPLLKQRASYNASGVTGLYTPGVSVVLNTVNAGTIPITGACSQPVCSTYGGQIQDAVAMTANSSVTLSLTAGQGVALASVSVNPTTVTGGNSATGTITLTGPAPASGISIGVSSSSSSATVPLTVIVSSGNTVATFTVSTTAVSSQTAATITAAYNGVNKTAPLTITPAAALSAVTLNPTTVSGGTSSTGTVTLNAPAPTGGASVTLSSNSAAASVPSSVSVTAGNTTATFTVTTTAVSSSTTAIITATYSGVNQTASLVITPVATLSSVSLNPSSVTGGGGSTGTVTLSVPAPTGGLTVGLASNSIYATVPTNVIVNAGNTTATFLVTTTAVASTTTATITASYNGLNKTAGLTITPAVALSSVSLNPTTVTGGSPSTGTVTLTGPAPAGGLSVSLLSNSASATVPANVSITAGSSTAVFSVTTTAVTASTTATITASYNGLNKTAGLTITPAVALSSVSLNPTSVVGGSPSTGTVTLSGPAPAGGLSVSLLSNSASATVPASVSVTAGSSTAVFTATTTAVTASTTATITASYNGLNKTAGLTITPPAALSSVSLNPTSVVGGSPSTGTVTLTGPAPAGGLSVNLSNNSLSAIVPSSVSVAAGSATATFTVTTLTVTSSTNALITASLNGVTKTATLSILSGTVSLASLTLNPTSIRAGGSSTGTVTLTGPAPAGGIQVTLSSSIPFIASVPATVTIPAGATTASFTVSTRFSYFMTWRITISAKYSGTVTSATLTVTL